MQHETKKTTRESGSYIGSDILQSTLYQADEVSARLLTDANYFNLIHYYHPNETSISYAGLANETQRLQSMSHSDGNSSIAS